MIILIALVIGAGLLPEKTEGGSCHNCARNDCFFNKETRTSSCNNDYCYFAFNPLRGGTEKQCVHTGNQTFEAACALENDERLKYSPNSYISESCFDPSQFEKVIKPCIERKWKEANKNLEYKLVVEEKDLSRTGGGGNGAEGSNLTRSGVEEEDKERSVKEVGGSFNWKTCYCIGDNCNAGEVPEYSETQAPDPINCYSCSGKYDCQDSEYPEVKRCPIPYCVTVRKISYSKSTSGREVVYKGCAPWSHSVFDANLGLQGSFDKIVECYRKGLKNGCRHFGRVKNCLRLGEISPQLSRPFLYGEGELEECMCEEELCNFDSTGAGGVNGATGVSFGSALLVFILIQGLSFFMG